jgi:hypothetical protein
MIIIDLFHLFNQLIQPDVVEIFIVALRNVMIRMFRILLPQDGEQNVIGVKIAGRFEVFIAVELHALRRVKVQVLPSGETVHAVASEGIGVFFTGSKVIRRLYSTCELATNEGPELAICGLNDSGDASEQ